MTQQLQFSVAGIPATKGSTKSFKTKTGKLITTGDNARQKAWEGSVAYAAEHAAFDQTHGRQYWAIVDSAVRLVVHFTFIRPKSVSAKRRSLMVVKPDLDKLGRAILDALTGVLFVDDDQVTELRLTKNYAMEGEHAGAHILIETLENPNTPMEVDDP